MSWIRSRDLRILSIGEVRYTRDSRFTPLHDAGNDVWALKIADAEMADSGEYECQVSETERARGKGNDDLFLPPPLCRSRTTTTSRRR